MKGKPWLMPSLAAAAALVILVLAVSLGRERSRGDAALRRAVDADAKALKLAADNARLKALVSNLSASLSATNAQYREWLRQRGQASSRNLRLRPAAPGGTPGFLDRNAWTFRGYDTPEHAFESVLWSMRQGDLDQLLGGFTAEFRQQTVNSLSREDLARIAAEAKHVDAVSLQTVGAIFQAPSVRPDGKIDSPSGSYMIFRRVGSEWRLDAQVSPNAGADPGLSAGVNGVFDEPEAP